MVELSLAVLLALGIRTFFYEAFKIPSEGMYPTLAVGDHIFVTKFAYGIPLKTTPRRGDLIVFRYPDPDPTHAPADFVKRVLALPGDVLTVEEGHPFINGWPVPRCLVGSMDVPGYETTRGEIYVEFLEDRAYLVVVTREPAGTKQGPFRVPAREIYVLGDNRNNSSDSRAWRGGLGAGVPFENVKGRASVVWLPSDRFGVSLTSKPALPAPATALGDGLAACLLLAPTPAQATPPRPRGR